MEQVPDMAGSPASSQGVASAHPPQTKRTSPLILILDYSLQIGRQLQRDLVNAGYRFDSVVSDIDAARQLREACPDLIVLDFTLQDMSGDLARLRRYTGKVSVPIIALVAEESEGLRALFAGADDFVVKPFSSIHLIARAQSLLRRGKSGVAEPLSRSDPRPILRINDLELDLESHRVRRGGRPIHLGPTEYRLLTVFMGSPGHLFSREDLLMAIWSDQPGTEIRTVDVYVSRLRGALNRGFRAKTLKTVRGVGYVLRKGRSYP